MRRRGKFELYKDNSGEWRWRLVAGNGQPIATSGEGYSSRRACENGIRSVRWNAPFAPTEVTE